MHSTILSTIEEELKRKCIDQLKGIYLAPAINHSIVKT